MHSATRLTTSLATSSDIPRPSFGRVEGDDANRVVELTRQQIVDDGFEGGVGLGGLAINPACFAEVVKHHVRDDADMGHQARCDTRKRHDTQQTH